jgi:hypothetical protein
MNTYFITINMIVGKQYSNPLPYGFVFYATEDDLHTSLDEIIKGHLTKKLGNVVELTYGITSLKNLSK